MMRTASVNYCDGDCIILCGSKTSAYRGGRIQQ
jgi:hypothetical protein